jgi:hypothetical protein
MTVETQNGVERPRGRAVPERLYPFTFSDTGYQVMVKKLSSFWRDTIRKQVLREPEYKKPDPPMFEHDYGQGRISAPNYSHPLYQQLLADWTVRVNTAVGERVTPFVIQHGVVCEIDDEAVRLARITAAENGIDLSEYDDHYVFVAFVCIGSFEDWQDLLRAVFERSAPTEAAIDSYKETFQSNV